MKEEIQAYNHQQAPVENEICNLLAKIINQELPEAESKIWHAHPVWFLNGNPVAGYSKLKDGVRLMFWSGVDFGEEALQVGSGKFKNACILYTSAGQVNLPDLERWLQKAREIQWDYKNLVKRKRKLIQLP